MNADTEKCVAQRMAQQKKVKQGRNTPSTTPMTPMVISDNIMKAENEDVKGWKKIWRLEKSIVACYVEDLKRKDDKLQKLSRNEWRETKTKLMLDNLKLKRDCLQKKMSS